MNDITAHKVRMRNLLEEYRSTIEGIKGDRFLIPCNAEQDAAVPAVSDENNKQSFSIEDCKARCQELDSEIQKVNRLEMVVAVVGTMKAGKSTVINALVGTELTPSRNSPMTTVPTLVRHNASLDVPELEFQNPEPLELLIAEIKQALPAVESELEPFFVDQPECRSLAQEIGSGSLQGIRSRAVGSESIGQVLAQVNDLARLARALDLAFPYHEYNEMSKYPVVSVRFSGLEGIDSGGGSFALLDTPGPNELGHSQELHSCLAEQLRRSSAVLAVMDYSQVNSEADGAMREQVRGILGKTHSLEDIYALLNKYDLKGPHDIGEDQQKQRVEQIFSLGNAWPASQRQEFHQQIFMASGEQAFISAWILRQLQSGESIQEDGWQEKFRKLVFGINWDTASLDDRYAVQANAEKLLEKSGFAGLGERLVERGYAQAAARALKIAAAKLRSSYRELGTFLNSKKGTLEQQAASAAFMQQQRSSQLEQQEQSLIELQQASQQLLEGGNSGLQQIAEQVSAQFRQHCQLLQGHMEELFQVDQRPSITLERKTAGKYNWASKVKYRAPT